MLAACAAAGAYFARGAWRRIAVPAAVLLAVAMSALVLRARPEGGQWTMER